MVNVAADIDEVCDVILALMSRLHTTLVKRECEGGTIYHPAKFNTNVWTPWTKKQQKSGSTSFWPNVLVN